MNRNQIAGNVKQVKGKFRVKWGRWTHQYSAVLGGRMTQLAGKLQAFYGKLVK
ncbi:MAG TPA: hypothetical protein VK463_17250 [Desulfomonilaceae bacterium]|nr:hypothetical protein [Desulfomonilaceae bacterium]